MEFKEALITESRVDFREGYTVGEGMRENMKQRSNLAVPFTNQGYHEVKARISLAL